MPKFISSRILVAATLAFSSVASAQDYPHKPITFVIPFSPGGSVDRMARVVAEKLRQKWDNAVIIQNRPGASGNIAAEAVFKAPPDGYTLLYTAPGPLVVHKSLFAKLAYEPDDFVPVSLVVQSPQVLIVPANARADSVQQLIAFAKANPGKLNYASAGPGTAAHLSTELFKSLVKIEIVHVPYKGAAPALTALRAGEVDALFENITTAFPMIQAGTVRALAIGSEKRNPALPDVPAMSELLPGFVALTWHGVVAPPRTSSVVVNKLSMAIAEVLKQPATVDQMRYAHTEAVGSTPVEMAIFMKQERERWNTVIRAIGAVVN